MRPDRNLKTAPPTSSKSKTLHFTHQTPLNRLMVEDFDFWALFLKSLKNKTFDKIPSKKPIAVEYF